MSNQSNLNIDLPAMNQLVKSFNELGLNIFQELSKSNVGENVVISPASIALALLLIYSGSGGATRDSLAAALGFQDLNNQQVSSAVAELLTHWRELTPGIQLNIANSLWVKEELEINDQFLNDCRESYEAEIKNVKFEESKTLKFINEWVSQKTEGKIENIINNIHPLAVLLVINAIYFKGIWSSPFKISLTKKGKFFLPNGRKKKLPMMSQTDHFQCYQGKNYKSISLPYGNDQIAVLTDPVPSMYVFLPEKNIGLTEFTRDIDSHKWEEMIAQFPPPNDYLCRLVLPRFKIDYEETLNAVLEQLGFGEMFIHNKADLGGMFKNASDAFINQVKHKTFIEVNEERTEAAAVTGFTHATGGPPKKYFEMVVDRPFFFVIRDNRTGAILFMGTIYDPG